MKTIFIALAAVLFASLEPGPAFAQSLKAPAVYAPLLLVNNGGGRVESLRDGEMLKVGRNYFMTASPNRGYVFAVWRRVNGFDYVSVTLDVHGNPSPPVTSTVLSPIPSLDKNPVLNFTMPPEDLLFDSPGVETITKRLGWEAVFVKATAPRPTE